MKAQLSTQEKLWDLRKEHDYKQEFVAKAINVSTATISKYENKDNKEFNLAILARLAKFYDVSLEWLAGTTEVRESSQTDVDELMLDDETIEAISCMTNIPNLIEKKDDYKTEGGYDMCQAIKELIEDSKAEGRTEGLALNAKIFKFIQANNNIDSESIAAACECTLDDVIEFRTAFGI